MWETHTPHCIYNSFCSNNAFNALVGALPLQIGVGVSIAISFTFSQSFFYSFDFSFSVLLRTFLSKEPLETPDSSTTFDFPVRVRVSNLLFIVGWFGCFLGRPIRFSEGFWSAFLRFYHWWDVKPPRGISLIFRGFHFHLRVWASS